MEGCKEVSQKHQQKVRPLISSKTLIYSRYLHDGNVPNCEPSYTIMRGKNVGIWKTKIIDYICKRKKMQEERKNLRKRSEYIYLDVFCYMWNEGHKAALSLMKLSLYYMTSLYLYH